MNKLKKRVHQALIDHTGARQSDNILMVILWTDDIYKNSRENKMRVSTFFKMLMYNELTNWESATRVRRELQKNHPELRDNEVYEKRHKRAEEYRDHYSSRYNFIGRK